MGQEDQPAQDEKRARRKRKMRTVGRAICLICACLLLPVFATAVWIGYLSWIGIIVGTVYLAPGIVSPLVGWAGRKRLEGFLSWLSIGMTILLPLAITIAAVWPEDHTKQWRPYRFDAELAALEAERAIPDQDNAALHCAGLFARLDVNDQPGFFRRTSEVRDKMHRSTWNRQEYPEASQWLDTYSWAVDQLLQAATTGTFRWPLQAYTYDQYTVPYKPLGRGIQYLLMSANRDLGEGRIDEALTKYFCVIRIAHDLRQQMQPLDWRIAFRYEVDALRMMREALVRHDFSDRDIAWIGQRLPSTEDPWPQDAQTFFQAEKLRYMNMLARLYEVNDEGEVRFASTITLSSDDPLQEEDRETGKWFRLYWRLNMPLDPKDLHAVADNYFTRFNPLLEPDLRPFPDREQGMTWIDLSRATANFYRWFAEMAFFQWEYPDMRQRHATLVAERRGTCLVLGLRRYRNERGAWPASLEQVSEYIPAEASLDPTSSASFVYARDGDNFKLYSKGINRLDEGGRDRYVKALGRVEDDIAIWPPYVREPPEPLSREETEEMLKQLAEIYGERFPMGSQEDANDR